jgi:hypothetical protein
LAGDESKAFINSLISRWFPKAQNDGRGRRPELNGNDRPPHWLTLFAMEGDKMPDPREPQKAPPVPVPDLIPDPPIDEPEPDRLPDEAPTPNPDETRNPPAYSR